MVTIEQAIHLFLENIRLSKDEDDQGKDNNTYKNYKSDLLGQSGFLTLLSRYIKPTTPASKLSENMAAQYLQELLNNNAAVSTRERRAAAVREFFRFAIARDFAPGLNIEKMNFMIKSGKLLIGKKRHIEFPMGKIERILAYVEKIKPGRYPNELEVRRNQAFIYTLAETGLRVGSACKLRVCDIDVEGQSALFIGKGDKQQLVYFGTISWKMLTTYLKLRGLELDQEAYTPLFTRHDKRAGKIPKPITEETAETIIHSLAYDALGDKDYDEKITCHSFRHYFVTQALNESGDLKMAQELANHASIVTTTRYAHRTNKQNRAAHSRIFRKNG